MADSRTTTSPSSPSAQQTHSLHPPDSSALSSADTTPLHSPRKEAPSPRLSHRSLLSENIRTFPPASPRAQRTQSFSGAALTELLMNQPLGRSTGGDETFKGRDWRTIQVHEIIDAAETRFVELDRSIEDTTKLLTRFGAPNVVLVRQSQKTKTAIDTFGYDELMAYLLLVLGITSLPDKLAGQLAHRARGGEILPLRDVFDHLSRRDPPTFLPHTSSLMHAMELLGGGLHRVIICQEGTSEAVGVLTQLRLVRFFWENHQSFAPTEQLYSCALKDLDLGAKDVVAINGDRPLSDALRLMHDEAITSLPVLDTQNNVVGNISHVDCKLLTDTSAIPLLSSSCIHFISVILSERGVQDGKDAYPVFHVTPFSTLAHTVAKLCATRSHRMWIVDAPSPSPSVPPSPGVNMHHAPSFIPSSPHAPVLTPSRAGFHLDSSIGPMSAYPGTSVNPSMHAVSAGQLPGAAMSGRLSGVVSLTDVLNLLAKASGLSPGDPDETRRRKRRSSSSSSRPKIEEVRASAEVTRNSAESTGTRGERRNSKTSLSGK